VFTNQRGLLYGDYLISCDEGFEGMATQIRFGSDTFKTWDDVAEYFERLGGQKVKKLRKIWQFARNRLFLQAEFTINVTN
jgi:hypothetical protein